MGIILGQNEIFDYERIARNLDKHRRNELSKEKGKLHQEKMQLRKKQHTPIVRADKKIGRNDPCPCGSGKKFKKCCISK